MWELQLPEDDVASAYHRWPIGFITTGFVHGRLGSYNYLQLNSLWTMHHVLFRHYDILTLFMQQEACCRGSL